MEPAIRLPAPGAGSVPMPENSTVMGEQAAAGRLQPGTSGGGVTCGAVLVGTVTSFQRSGPLKPTGMDSDPFEAGVSMETNNRCTYSDMSGTLSDMPDATTSNAQVTKVCLPAGKRPNKTPSFTKFYPKVQGQRSKHASCL